jgi:predicted amidohydrolase
MTRIDCRQLAPKVADLEANWELSVQAVHQAVAEGADIVVLPELVTSGYVFESREEAASVAITSSHPLFGDWGAEAALRSAIVIGGFCEMGSEGRLYNSAALVDASGVVAVYRKTHLWNREKTIFEPGSEPPKVFETAAGRIGVLICYDLEFPEMTRALALAGADLIVVPANWPLVSRPLSERPPEVVIAMAAARINRIFIACCDRTGTERAQQWTSGSTLINESGWVIAKAGDTGVAQAEVDLSRARVKTLTDFNDALDDRRPELYRELTKPAQ